MSTLFTAPTYTVWDSNGNIVPGGKVFFYRTNSLTLAPVYADSELTTPLLQPVVANSAGKCPAIYLDSNIIYRCIVQDAAGVEMDDVDPITSSDSTSEPAYDVLASGIIFDTARGDLFSEKWTIPTDATLTVVNNELIFNSPATPKTLRMKLKNLAGTGDFKGCYEGDWEVDYTIQLLGSFSSPDVKALEAGFVVEDARLTTNYHGTRISSHPATGTQLFSYLDNVSSQIDFDAAGGYTYAVNDTIRIRAKRSGATLTGTVNYNGGADRAFSEVLHTASDDHELPRLLSTPMFFFAQGYYKIVSAKVSVGETNYKLGIAGTSLAQSRYSTTYAQGYAQVIKAAHADNVTVFAAPSGTSTDILGALPDFITHSRPDTILFEPFANDVLATVPLATTQSNVAAIVSLCEANGITPLFLNAPPLNSTFATAINAWLLTTTYNYYDIYSVLVGSGIALAATYDSGDNIHWNTAGHTAVASAVDAWLTSRGTYSGGIAGLLVDTDPAFTANSDVRVASQKATKTYVDTQIGGVPPRGNSNPMMIPNTGDVFVNVINGTSEAPGTIAYAADRMDLVLYHPANSFTTSSIQIDVQTAAAAGKRAKIVIYTDSDGVPGTLLASSGHLVVDSTGLKTWTVSQTFEKDTRYWVGIHSEDTVTVYAPALRHCRSINYDTTAKNHTICWRKSSSYAGGPPTPLTGATATNVVPALLIFTAA